MFSFLSSIGSAFGIVVQFISNLLDSLITLFLLIPQALVFLASLYAILPGVLLVFCTAGIAVVVVLQVVGR